MSAPSPIVPDDYAMTAVALQTELLYNSNYSMIGLSSFLAGAMLYAFGRSTKEHPGLYVASGFLFMGALAMIVIVTINVNRQKYDHAHYKL
jgi:hypothetical protein